MGTLERESNDNSEPPREDTEEALKLVQNVTLAEEDETQMEYFILALSTSWFWIFLSD